MFMCEQCFPWGLSSQKSQCAHTAIDILVGFWVFFFVFFFLSHTSVLHARGCAA